MHVLVRLLVFLALIGGAFPSLVLAQTTAPEEAAGASPSWAKAVRSARDRLPAAAGLEDRRRADAVQRDDAGRWVRQPPFLTGRYQTDEIGENIGLREWESTVNLPLTPPGERASRRRLSEQRRTSTSAYEDRIALMAAGEVRAAAWLVRRAEVDLEVARHAAETARLLETDLEVRVREGARPEADLPLVQAETFAQESAVEDAQAELAHARARYRMITGLDVLPAPLRETVAAADDDSLHRSHPAARDALARRDRAQQAYELAGDTWVSKPTLGVGMRGERAAAGTESVESLGIFLTVPLDFGHFNRPAEVQSLETLGDAERTLAQTLRAIALDFDQAVHRLEAARRAVSLAQRREQAASEALRLSRVAFDLGEAELVSLLRVRDSALTALAAAKRRRVELGRAISQFNQAAGVMPQ